jgi:hypothetical protein
MAAALYDILSLISKKRKVEDRVPKQVLWYRPKGRKDHAEGGISRSWNWSSA